LVEQKQQCFAFDSFNTEVCNARYAVFARNGFEHIWQRGNNVVYKAVAQLGDSLNFVGTPDDVASMMEDAMKEVGGDGFLFYLGDVSRHSVAEITDGHDLELKCDPMPRWFQKAVWEKVHPHV
jgi:alkanesulfonate monooxygenase SsuD/methylene tetrahydromethanopterin reductase-like flavin-dependent oxidoreductase (luciferase family)